MGSRHRFKVVIGLPVLFQGGTEIQTLQLVRALIGAEYIVTVCCYYEYELEMVKRFEEVGAGIHLMRYNRAEGLWHLAKGLMRLFKQTKPDIIHVQYLAPGLVPIISARLAGIRTIFATVHQPGRIYGWKEKMFIRLATQFSTVFFCVSRAVEESWFGDSAIFDPAKPMRRKHCTIYNAVDVEKIIKSLESTNRCGLRKALNVTGKKVIGFVGRIRREKGLDILIDALPHVLGKHPDVVLVVVGDGPDKTITEQRAKNLGINEQIRWMGQKSQEEVYQIFSIMDVVAVPSRFEGFGLSAAEAMVMGLPVVATRVDGLSEVVEDRVSGFLFNEGDDGELARAAIDLLADAEKARKMGQIGHALAKQKFSFEHFTKLTILAYECYS